MSGFQNSNSLDHFRYKILFIYTRYSTVTCKLVLNWPHSKARSDIRLVLKKIRWRPFLWYSNGIKKPDHLASNLFSTIWISNKFDLQILTVLQFSDHFSSSLILSLNQSSTLTLLSLNALYSIVLAACKVTSSPSVLAGLVGLKNPASITL